MVKSSSGLELERSRSGEPIDFTRQQMETIT